MNTKNPFQIPSCFAELQQRRQQRLKKIVVGSVSALSALLVVLLIEGCMTEKSKTSAVAPPAVAQPTKSEPAQVANATLKPVLTLPTKTVTLAPVVPAASKPVATPASNAAGTFYVVKPGDTLTRIAKVHGLTIKSLKAINGLSGDNIAVGAKLKLPTA